MTMEHHRGATTARVVRTVASVLSAVVLLASLTTSCGRDPYVPLKVGQCLPDGSDVEGRRAQDPRTVDCSEPHRYEVFAVVTLDPPSREWPGEEVVSANAEKLCVEAIPEATGLDPADTPDDVGLLHIDPTESSWRGGDRDVECLFRWDGRVTTTLTIGHDRT